MLTKLRVSNFRSLKNLTLEFSQPLTVLVGSNNSGKSNILHAIEFLGKFAGNDRSYQVFRKYGGYQKVVFGGVELNEISFEISGELSEKEFLYQVDFINESKIGNERLVGNGMIQLFRGIKGHGKNWDDASKKHVEYTHGSDSLAIFNFNDIRRQGTIMKYADFIKQMKVYDFVPSSMRKYQDVTHDLDPGKFGENLPIAIHSIMSSKFKENFSLIQDAIIDAISFVDDLNSPLNFSSQVYISLKEGKNEFVSEQLSAGTLKFLAILSLLYSPEPPTVIGLEEPENHIHPRLLEMLVEIIVKSGHQVVISTHSPHLLNLVPLESIRIVEKEDGGTTVRSVKDQKELQEAIKNSGFLPGDLWLQGELGGVPE